MDMTWKPWQYFTLRHTATLSQLKMFALCLLLCTANNTYLSKAASAGMETFEERNDIPAFQCGRSGWFIQRTDGGSHAFSTCDGKCAHNLTIAQQSYSNLVPVTVMFDFALVNVQDGTDHEPTAPILTVYCEQCSMARVWTSSSLVPLINGEWKSVEVNLKPYSHTFNLIFEANIQTEGQAIGLDNVILKNKIREKRPVPSLPLSSPINCLNGEPIDNSIGDDDQTSLTTQGNGDEWPGDNSPASSEIGSDGTTSDPSNAEPKNAFGLLDNETTLLFAQILAILSVTVCFITVGIHCLIWKKQRRLQRVRSVVPMRRKVSEVDPHDSMLLEMNLIASDEPDQPCSNSLSEPSRTRFLQQLKETDVAQHGDGRRATVSCVSTRAHSAAAQYDSEDDSEDDKEPPHPRTKSLPCRPPVNVYESIDEVSKYQPLTFGKRPAPKPPGVPGGRRLNSRARGVQNLAAVKKYRPSSVQYEEIGNRNNGLLDEQPRDRSKSASQYDYIKKKSTSQSPRRNGWRYGQASRPKGRAPAPPTNRLYDEPVRKTRPVMKVDSAPTLLLQNQELSGGEAIQTDNESIPGESYDKTSASTQSIRTRPGTESQYFTLEPPVGFPYATSDDSDDERDSEKDTSRFEDAEEAGSSAVQNSAVGVPVRPLSISAPIDIPPSITITFDDCEIQSSRL